MMLRRLSRLLLFNRFRLAYRRLRLHGSIVLLRLKTMHQQPSSCHKHDGKHRQCRKHKFATAGRKHFRIGRVHRSFLYFMAPLPSSGPSQLITSRITDMPLLLHPEAGDIVTVFSTHRIKRRLRATQTRRMRLRLGAAAGDFSTLFDFVFFEQIIQRRLNHSFFGKYKPLALIPAKRTGRVREMACADSGAMPIMESSRLAHCG